MPAHPRPIFEFRARRELYVQGAKAVHTAGLYGDDVRVADGSWRAVRPERGGLCGGGGGQRGGVDGPRCSGEGGERGGRGERVGIQMAGSGSGSGRAGTGR